MVSVGGAGATPAVSVELKLALTAHELAKVLLPSLSKPQKTELLERLCQETGAISVQLIGRVGVAYRPAPIPRIHLA